ncbi:9816_t:CDS:2 [Rhizophagus irregularis]|nr:9816_t:CDS:2 [Rhizophagus irregularis]
MFFKTIQSMLQEDVVRSKLILKHDLELPEEARSPILDDDDVDLKGCGPVINS